MFVYLVHKSVRCMQTDPARSAIIDSCIRVTDNGRENINRKVFFIFSVYNTSNHNDQLKLGASSSEEAARWIHSLQEAALKIRGSSRINNSNSIDWTRCSSSQTDLVTSDVIAPSSWTIFGCQNGLRLFKEAKDRDSRVKQWDDPPAIMAVGVVDGSSEAIFRTLMSLGASRSEWDFCFDKGSVVEHLDGHTDIIHKQLFRDWLPWLDLALDVKIYVEDMLYRPNKGKQSVVKHMLAIDWKFWRSCVRPSLSRSITIQMLGRIAALREMYRARLGNYTCPDFSSGELTGNSRLNQIEGASAVRMLTGDGETKESMAEEERTPSENASLVSSNDAADEFFDVPEPADCEQPENSWTLDFGPDMCSQQTQKGQMPSSDVLLECYTAVQKRGYVDLQEMARDDFVPCCYGTTLAKDPTCTLACSWTAADPSTFLIRGENYLQNRKKVKAKSTLMQMVGADWLKSDKREDDLGGRPGSIVQKYAAQGGSEFFFIVNIQVPGSTRYNLALYYMMNTPVADAPLLESFIKGDDAYRNSRFKLIPYISKGSWIVKQSVGKKACLIGQALEINYFHGKNYLELGIDIGSSTVARGVVSLVLGYLNNLVIEMAFLVQGNTSEELPEYLLGTCLLNHLDASKAVLVNQ
ncbi:Protein ENHANCED DISEASE RESISTANCE 2 [Morella rubra]|uniref:Protein ENHANCED DISEASE RESISTANCE 2 n=1 Tax=Morella rubra TaxID=262757 RepID=A0A6A1WLV8_9ROSI|nr:Protein ENHANCED DISEASE RESISTANCE 2 [Morella rubra]